MLPEFTVLVTYFGPWIAAALSFIALFANKLLPFFSEERKREAEERRADKDLLMKLVSQNTEAFTEMRVTLQQVTEQLGSMAEAQTRLNEDVAGLYGHIGVVRPSREQHQAVQPVSVEPAPRRRRTDAAK